MIASSSRYKSVVVYVLYGVYTQIFDSFLRDPKGRACDVCRIGRCSVTPWIQHSLAETCSNFNTCYQLYFILLSAFVGGHNDSGVLVLTLYSLVRGVTSVLDLEIFVQPWRRRQHSPPKRGVYIQYHTVSKPRSWSNNPCRSNHKNSIRRSWSFPFLEESVPARINCLFCDDVFVLCEWYYKGRGWKWGRKKKDIRELRWDGRDGLQHNICNIFIFLPHVLRARVIICMETEVA
jgi:hypothetical protein